MKKNIHLTLSSIFLLTLSACSFIGQQLADKKNEERLLKPGALDLPLTSINDTYQYKFLNKYRVTHQWPRTSNCNYRKTPTLGANDGSTGEFFSVLDIYEADGHTWQVGTVSFEEYKRTRYMNRDYPTPIPTFDDYAYYLSFDRYVRSVKIINPVVYDKTTRKRIEGASEEIEGGLQSLCFQSWYASSHTLIMRLHKLDIQAWKAMWTKNNPRGKWSEQRVAGNLWMVQETEEKELSPRSLGASGGWFQGWLRPIGDTGYTISLQLGASQESLQNAEAHTRFKTAFRHLIESVKVEQQEQ